MAKPSDGASPGKQTLRDKILGFGETSLRKSYYPVLMERRQELERYNTLLNEAGDAIGLLELPSLRLVDLNRTGRRLLAVSPDEPLPTLTDLVDQAAKEAIMAWAGRVIDGISSGLLISTALLYEYEREQTVVELSLSHSRFGESDYGVVMLRDITELKLAEQALRQSENKLKSIIGSAPVGIGVFQHRIFQEANLCLCEMTGYRRHELIGNNSAMLYLNREEYERYGQEMYSRILQSGIATAELKWRRKDGSPIDILLSLTPIEPTRPDGENTFTVLDITARKQAEHALRQSESKLKSIIGAAPAGIGVVIDRVFQEANQYLCDLTGYSREELLGCNSRMLYADEAGYRWVARSMYPRIVNGGIATAELKWRRKDGSLIDVSLNLTPVDVADPVGAVTFTVLDITDRKRAEKALLSSEESLRITLDSIGDAVIATDCGGRVTMINPVAVALTGFKAEDAVGKPLTEVFRIVNAETRIAMDSPVEKVIGSGKVVGLANHTVLLSGNGKEYQIADSGAPIRNDNGEIVGVVLVFRDVSSQYEMEEKLRQSEKMESIGKLAGGIAHDFNNMLTGIMASADLLGRRIGQHDEGMKNLVGIIKDSCHKAADLTQKLLAFARKARLVSRPVDIHTAINDATALLERSIDRRIEIVRHFTAKRSTVNGDPSQLANVFLNLGVNSRDAMPDGGVIMIETDNVSMTAERSTPLGNLAPGEYVHIRFIDNGCGIAAEHLARIFEPFFTTKEVGKGSGLGLSAVYGAIQEHGGGLEVESAVGDGTTFELYLPCVEVVEAAPPDEEEYSPPCSGCVLVIDDEDLVRFTAREILQDNGFEVILAVDGIDGIEKFRQFRDKIDLVILDMIMPRMNGRECYIELLKLNPGLKIIVSTGYISDRNTNEHFTDGVAGFIRKPFTITELTREINRVMGH